MKSWTLLALFISVPVFACPQLAGNYKTCRVLGAASNAPSTAILVRQKLIDQLHQFDLSVTEAEGDVRTEIYLADGKTKTSTNTDEDTGVTIQTRTTSSCTAKELLVSMEARMDSQEFAKISIRMSKSGKQLVQVFKGTSMGEPINDTVICE